MDTRMACACHALVAFITKVALQVLQHFIYSQHSLHSCLLHEVTGCHTHTQEKPNLKFVKMAQFVRHQTEVIDRMLLNAYGTTYKIAAKYLIYQEISHEWSATEELLLAKNLVTNLWSVLDYACYLLYVTKNGKPSSKIARKIAAPCYFPKKKVPKEDKAQKVAAHAGEAQTGRKTQKATTNEEATLLEIEALFQDLQYSEEKQASDDVFTYYRLHFLRNTFTHRTIIVTGNSEEQIPAMLQGITRTVPEVAVSIQLPKSPWESDLEHFETVSLLDFLFKSCELVKKQRNKILQNTFQFGIRLESEQLVVQFPDTSMVQNHKDLHLKCYGLEQEYEEAIQKTFVATEEI